MFVPNCPRLSTLFLQNIDGLYEGLPNSFFMHMVDLRVLDLSSTYISFLPDSIYDMVNLRALILRDCGRLKHVDSLAKLKELRELDLSQNYMETIPDGIEKLVLLKKFSWSTYVLPAPLPNFLPKPFPKPLPNFLSKPLPNPLPKPLPNPLSNLLPNLLQLQFLRFEDRRFLDVGVEELSGLRKLEILFIEFTDQHNFNSYMRTQHHRRLTHYQLQLNRTRDPFSQQYPPSLIFVPQNPREFSKEVVVWKCKLKEGGKDSDDHQLVLPTNLHLLQIRECHLPTSLLDVSPALKIAMNLKACFISRCEGIKYLWWVEDCIASLNTLYVEELERLSVLFKLRPTDIVSCSGLKHLYVISCGNLKHLFTPELVKYHLQNLQTIYVRNCRSMEDIIAVAIEVEEAKEDINEMNDDLILCFPNLQALELGDLPKLKSIWKATMTCESLQKLEVWGCPKLKRLLLSVHINDGDGEIRTSTPHLKEIIAEDKWLDELEWDTHPHAKSLFEPLFVEPEGSLLSLWEDTQNGFTSDIKDNFEEVD